jgi:ribonuclease D
MRAPGRRRVRNVHPVTRPPPPHPQRLPPPVLVRDEHGLAELCRELARETVVAVDTEADSFFHYRERVCLVQLSAGERDWLVDPLAGIDLAPLGELFADARRTKVFHDGEYDVLILKRDYGFSFAGLFDTRVAAAALGISAPGLASLVSARYGVQLDKSLQRSDWSARPLSARQIDYARLDTRYLIPLMQDLSVELEPLGRRVIVEGECRRLERLAAPVRGFEPDEFIRIKGARRMNPRQQQALRELFVLRDELARARDLPPFKVLGNDALTAIAAAQPRHPEALAELPGLSPRLLGRLGRPILDALRRAHEKGPLARPPRLPAKDGTSELDDAGFELHERLKSWRKEQADSDRMDSSLVLHRSALQRTAEARPKTAAELERLSEIQPWQVERYGAAILRVVARFESDLAAGRIELSPRRRGRREFDD